MPSNLAGKNKWSRSSKADPEEPPAKWPTQPQVVGTVTFEGEAMSKDKASEFKCNMSPWNTSRPQTGPTYLSRIGDEGGKGEFDDDDDGEEENNYKVKIPGLNGDDDDDDDDDDDAPNDRQPSKSDCKMEPDDEGDIGEEEHPKKKSHKDKKKKRSFHNRKSKVEEEEEDLDEAEVPFIQWLWDVRYKKFCEDTDEANYVKGILLGLGSGMIPTQAQIDQSELFHERPSDKTAPVADVSNAWMPILEERLWLTMEAPDKMKHKDGTMPPYTSSRTSWSLCPAQQGPGLPKVQSRPSWLSFSPPPWLPWRPLLAWKAYITWPPYARQPFQSCPGDPEKKAKQFSFCGYCRVRIENFEIDVNHIRHHLRLELLCGGCNGKAFITNVQMSSHLKKCEAILNILGQLGNNKQGGSQNRKR